VSFDSTYYARLGEVAPRESARPSTDLSFDEVFDVVVVGGGAGGMASTVFTAWAGNSVALVEKAAEIGGTTIKSGLVSWIPNNGLLREAGIEEQEEDFLRFAARTSRPDRYDPQSPTFGQSQWEYDQCKAFFHSAWPALKALNDGDALRYATTGNRYLDYWADLPEDTVPCGRPMSVEGGDLKYPDGGYLGINSMRKAAEKAGASFYTGFRVQRLIVNGDGAVVGVVATSVTDGEKCFGARKGVIFGTGGFSHDPELRQNYLAVPIVGSGAALTNEGDFVRIATAVGAQLRTMQSAWWAWVNLEGALRRDPGFRPGFLSPGDSMIFVNVQGRRFVNEKMHYADSGLAVNQWDAAKAQYPNLVMIQLWDQHTKDNSAADYMGSSVVREGDDARHVITGSTLAELTENIEARLAGLTAHTGNAHLATDFLENLKQTITRWNEMSRRGVDEDFHRGTREIDLKVFAGRVAREPGKLNPVMWPISDSGPYYATILMPGTLDTRGGPKTDEWARVVDDMDVPIPGLYGVGNCVATPRAYFGPGGSIGPILAFAYRAAESTDREPVRPLPEPAS
jgi:3-oxosteroid 1-dehydrogenase